MSLAAGAGLGKSSVSMLFNAEGPAKAAGLHIGAWFSTEQDPYQVAAMATRLGVPCPPIWPVNPAEPFNDALRGLKNLALAPGSVIVFDSLTPLGLQDAVRMMNVLIMYAREEGWRVAMINQTNKLEQVAGSSTLVFMPDIDVRLVRDLYGQRRLFVSKNRYGGEYVRYYTFSETGAVIMPKFGNYPHSVEGRDANLELIPFGLASGSIAGLPGQARGKSIQWASCMDPLAHLGLLPKFAGFAMAGFESPSSPNGFMTPPDEAERKKFAAVHGMKWLSMEELSTILKATAWTPLASRLAAKARQKYEISGSGSDDTDDKILVEKLLSDGALYALSDDDDDKE